MGIDDTVGDKRSYPQAQDQIRKRVIINVLGKEPFDILQSSLTPFRNFLSLRP